MAVPIIAVAVGAAVVAGVSFVVGKAIEDAGEGIDQAGSGFLKFAAAGGVGVAAYIALRRSGVF